MSKKARAHCSINKEWAGKAKSSKLEFQMTIKGHLAEEGANQIRSVTGSYNLLEIHQYALGSV